MEFRQLHTFLTLAEIRGFTRTAEWLGYAQSSVTAQIQALEEELGVKLFDRLGKKVVLTEAGEKLLPVAQEIQRLHDYAKELVRDSKEPSGTLVIGATESLAAYRLPPIIQSYRQRFPQVKLILRPGFCSELRNDVREGKLDMSFLLGPEVPSTDLILETLALEKMVLIAPNDHRLIGTKGIDAHDLQKEMILHTEPGSSYRMSFEQYLKSHNILEHQSGDFWNIEAIKSCVISGLGISYLPKFTIESELRENKLSELDWKDPIPAVSMHMTYHKSKVISPALREWMNLVLEHAKLWQEAQAY
ncbi:LysR family transcriptional regulator [Ammoniphilus sp. CFH 90114]|uniref:LysR family transcriptional regulator n=1 Tax=Ammoniphilus sp. CFH 90114 TaxID=2493665 RepID=UPI00100E3BAD|nr:LysR family transcriptional regulator [Ammoniphilus sp. CFH 90114]RXT13717.1 LysR family transcriptional regulator [Ammoniphilus sp. CFH 90114]